MTSGLPAALQPLLADPARSAILLDFDGTLAEIMERPELAVPVDGAREAVAGLLGRFGVVAVISGRPTDDVRALLDVNGVRYLGLYGLGEDAGPVPQAIREAAETRATAQEGEYPETWNAHVRLHVMVGIEPALITDIAEGLNRSLQVDNPSLENLRGTFDEIKKFIEGKRGAQQIAYRQGDTGASASATVRGRSRSRWVSSTGISRGASSLIRCRR